MVEIIQHMKDFCIFYLGLGMYISCFLIICHIVGKRSSEDGDHKK